MPEMTGLEMLKILQQYRPQIILTTAFPQFALEGFEMEVADYLLKPISFDSFYKAVYKVLNRNKPKGNWLVLKTVTRSQSNSLKKMFFGSRKEGR